MSELDGREGSLRRLGIRVAVVVVVVTALLGAACGKDAAGPAADKPAEVKADLARDQVPADQSAAAVTATDGLAADLYRTLATGDKNLVFSPYSVEIALAMTRNGAKGETRAQMDKVLRADAALDRSLNALDAALASRNGDRSTAERKGSVSLENANALWGQVGFPFDPVFLAELARDYGAGMQTVDYAKDAEAARMSINNWAAARTHDKIKDLLPSGVLDSLTRLVLGNAVYFKAPWETKFDAATPKPFTKTDGSVISVPTMRVAGHTFTGRYGEGAGWKAGEIPYLGGELSMVVVVPDDLKAFEASLDGATLAGVIAGLHDSLTNAQMPKFTFRTSVQLQDQLGALGMPLAFGRDADFSGMDGRKDLFVKAVVHQAFIAVDEEGTEAAAATAVVAELKSLRVGKVLVADRPFLFVITDNKTGTPLFLGRVTDPSVSGS